MTVPRSGHEEEAPARRRVERSQSAASGPDEQRENTRVNRDLERLHSRALRDRPELALDLERVRGVGDDDSGSFADVAACGEDLARAVRDVLACHLDEPERRDLDDVRLRPVPFELRAQRLLDGLAILRIRHVDEVDDDDPADVAQAKLADDLLHGLEVVLDDRVLEAALRALPARADEATGVDVDDREGLGVVEDEVATRRKIDAPLERRADLGIDARGVEERLLVAIAVHTLDHVRRRLLEVADDAPVGAIVVDPRADEVAREEVSHDPQGQLRLLVDERRGRLAPWPSSGSSSRAAAGTRDRARCPPPTRPRRPCAR